MEDVDVSIDRVIAGVEKKSKVMTDDDKEITAYHEVGHALILKLVKSDDVLHKVSIIPRGMALGVTWHKPKDESVSVRKTALLAKIAMALGGRAAEEIIYGKDNITTGASQDIKQATDTARAMVMKYGMSDKVGFINFEQGEDQVFMGRDLGHMKTYGTDTVNTIEAEVKRIIDECYTQAKKILLEKEDVLRKGAEVLMQKEKIGQEEFEAIYYGRTEEDQ